MILSSWGIKIMKSNDWLEPDYLRTIGDDRAWVCKGLSCHGILAKVVVGFGRTRLRLQPGYALHDDGCWRKRVVKETDDVTRTGSQTDLTASDLPAFIVCASCGVMYRLVSIRPVESS